jgi:hypothetical protein
LPDIVFELVFEAVNDGECSLTPRMIFHPTLLISVDLLVDGRWGSWNDTAGLPPTLVLLALREIFVSSTFII